MAGAFLPSARHFGARTEADRFPATVGDERNRVGFGLQLVKVSLAVLGYALARRDIRPCVQGARCSLGGWTKSSVTKASRSR